MENNFTINRELGVAMTDTFSTLYPELNHWILEKNEGWDESRAGNIKETMNFKTIITNPYRRVVGGYNRNPNVFFLLAEAMWIFIGRKDVRFLTLFNKKMAEFSDDGKVFHAPYGFRLRHWGVRSEDKYNEENLHAAQGYDQVEDAIRLLANNPNTRQVVMSIWNTDFDLGTQTKDIPCNDLVMLKIRNGKMVTTIQNRSNDLHLGLPTNVFQFSFLTEMMAGCLGIELGTQTHNSQSLHIYDWCPAWKNMENSYSKNEGNELYNEGAEEHKVDFNFAHDVATNRLREVDMVLSMIIGNLENISRGKDEDKEEIKAIEQFSEYLYKVYLLLKVYLLYKAEISGNKDAIAPEAVKAIGKIDVIADGEWDNWDIAIMARNYFAKRAGSEFTHEYLGTL